jgi:hypothetical protein
MIIAGPTNNSVILSWASSLTDVSIHTYTPSDDCGTLNTLGPLSGASLVNFNEGWTYTCAVNGNLNGSPVSGIVSFSTLGQSPNGTQAKTVQFAASNVAPTVQTNPSNQSVTIGQTATFAAQANGTPVPTVQWMVEASGSTGFVSIAGATSNTLILTSVTAAQSGNKYHVVYTNSAGTSVSTDATLTVMPPTKTIKTLLVTYTDDTQVTLP